MASELKGVAELSAKLRKLGPAIGGKALRSAAFKATTPALQAARAAAPAGRDEYSGEYSDGPGKPRRVRTVRPYPGKTYKGRLKMPGYASRNLRRVSYFSPDRTAVSVHLGVRREAFYALSFVEFGTSRTPPRPWLEPTWRALQSTTLARLAEMLRREVEKAAR